jgi:hypothetical protein
LTDSATLLGQLRLRQYQRRRLSEPLHIGAVYAAVEVHGCSRCRCARHPGYVLGAAVLQWELDCCSLLPLASELGDYLRYSFFDKYFKEQGCQSLSLPGREWHQELVGLPAVLVLRMGRRGAG